MNKKQIVGFCGLILMMCFGLLLALGCKEDKEVEPVIEEVVEVEKSKDEIVEIKEDIQEPEEVVVEEVVEPEVVEETQEEVQEEEFDYDELHYYLTTTLSDSEYEAYFNEIIFDSSLNIREIEFDAHILEETKSEKYKTRCELLLGSGDYDNGNFTGPYIKTRDIAYIDLEGAHEGSNVRVRATIDGYDMDGGYLKITIRDISVR